MAVIAAPDAIGESPSSTSLHGLDGIQFLSGGYAVRIPSLCGSALG
jgi:hypothetical protein